MSLSKTNTKGNEVLLQKIVPEKNIIQKRKKWGIVLPPTQNHFGIRRCLTLQAWHTHE